MDLIKNLTGKDPKGYEPVASRIINEPDVELFEELVSKDDYLFDFIKQNVAQRLAKACNKSNFKNLFKFLNIYTFTITSYLDIMIAQDKLQVLQEGFSYGKSGYQ